MISRNNHKMLILAVSCALGAIIAIPGFMMKSQDSNISSIKSALLNSKYIPEVNEITLTFPETDAVQQEFLFRKGLTRQGTEGWTCTTADGMSFPANATIISQLLNRSSQTRSMAEISDSYTAWSALGLSDDSAIHLQFSSESITTGTKTFSSLFFGYENADGSMIYVRNDRKSTSWRIQNDISSYLSDSYATWADQHLLPIGRHEETDPTISCILVETAENSRRIYNTDDMGTRFDEIMHTLLSLRSSEFLSPEEFSRQPLTPELIMTVTLSALADDDYSYGFHVYSAEYEDEPFFFVQNFGIMNKEASNYYQVISTWTWDKIYSAL